MLAGEEYSSEKSHCHNDVAHHFRACICDVVEGGGTTPNWKSNRMAVYRSERERNELPG